MIRLLPAALVAALLVFLLLRAGIDLSARLALACAALAYVAASCGRLIAPGPSDACSAFALGLLAICLFVYALTAALPVTATGAFMVVGAVVVLCDLVLARRSSAPAANDTAALIGFALCIALTAAWCSTPASAYESVRTDGVLPVWSDYFFHGGLISQFGDVRALGRGSIYLADHPSSFYHFASYAAAAALAGLLDQPGLPLAVAAWLPLGFLAMLAGAYALGTRLAGAAGGIAALVAVGMLPDASNYGLRNGWFSFHFTLLAHAGATYALGAAFLSLALLDRWSAERSRWALVMSALLACAMLLFRAHLFVLFVPVWAAAAALCSLPGSVGRRRIAWLMIASLAVAAAVASLLVEHLAQEGWWRFSGPALGKFLTIVHTYHEPTAYTDVYADLASLDEPGFTLIAGIALAVAAALGAFVVLLPLAVRLAAAAGMLKPIDAACGYLIFCWLLLMLFAPEPWHGDASDLIHRPSVLVYTASAVWTFCLLLRLIEAKALRSGALWPATLAVALGALPALVASADDMARPKFRWGALEAASRVPAGLMEAAHLMRTHAEPGDTFAVARLTERYATFDVAMQLCALSGMPAYLSRPHFEMIKDAPRKRVVEARLAALNEVARQEDYARAMRALQHLAVQWYVVSGAEGPRWDPDRSRAAFSAGSVAIYASGRALHHEMRIGNTNQPMAHEASHGGEFDARQRLVGGDGAHVAPAVE